MCDRNSNLFYSKQFTVVRFQSDARQFLLALEQYFEMTENEAVWAVRFELDDVSIDIGARLWSNFINDMYLCVRNQRLFCRKTATNTFLSTPEDHGKSIWHLESQKMQNQQVQIRTSRTLRPEIEKSRKREIQKSCYPVTYIIILGEAVSQWASEPISPSQWTSERFSQWSRLQNIELNLAYVRSLLII